jgi:hypothetical protein
MNLGQMLGLGVLGGGNTLALGGAGLAGLGSIGGSIFGRNSASQAENQLWNIGDPYRSQLQNISNNPDAYFQGPQAQSLAKMLDQHYSSQFGNPAGSGTAQSLAADALLRGYGAERDRLFNYGGGQYLNQAYPAALTAKGKAGQGIFNSVGATAGGLLSLLGGGGGLGGGDPQAGLIS